MRHRILFVDHDDGRSGATVSLEYLVDAFAKSGDQVFVLTPKRTESTKSFLEAGATLLLFGTVRFDVLRLSTHEATEVSFLSLKGLRWLINNVIKFVLGYHVVARAIKQVRPDLVYVNEHVVIQASLAAHIHRIPCVIHIRSQLMNSGCGIPRRIISRFILTCNRKVFPITTIEAEQLRPKGREAEKIQVVGEFAPDVEEASSLVRKSRQIFGLPATKNVVTLLGGFARIKGTLDFVRAAHLVCSARNDVVFVIAGRNISQTSDEERSYYEECNRVIQTMPGNSSVLVLGEIGNPLDLISCTDILVSPSTRSHFSRPIIEAWAFSKPVIAAHSDHMNNLINEGKDGLLYNPGDESELANCLASLLVDRKLRHRLGREGKKRAESEFNAALNTQAIIRQCSMLISSKN